MNEIVYNILRKFVEDPENFEVREQPKRWPNFDYVNIRYKGTLLVSLCYSCSRDKWKDSKYYLTDKECRRILRGMEHVQAMKIRNL